MDDTIEIYENEDSDRIAFKYNTGKFSDHIKFLHENGKIEKAFLEGSYIIIETTCNTAFKCTLFDRHGNALDKFVQVQSYEL